MILNGMWHVEVSEGKKCFYVGVPSLPLEKGAPTKTDPKYSKADQANGGQFDILWF